MIEIRPVWIQDNDAIHAPNGEVADLLTTEKKIIENKNNLLRATASLFDDYYVKELTPLLDSAQRDLTAGCELARTGYLKQSYSLWRSWFEQSVFFLYFLEAPLHKAAWNVKAEVSADDNPQYRLMLHQLLSNSGERHPFAIVYEARFANITSALKYGSIPKDKRPIQRAGRVLTQLSQGVHGTYRPQVPSGLEELRKKLREHCIPVLIESENVLNTLWLSLFADLLALPEQILVKLREGNVTVEEIKAAEIDEVEAVQFLTSAFSQTFPA